MTEHEISRRSLDYLLLGTCERLGWREQEILELPYDDQLRLIAFHQIRCREEAAKENVFNNE